MLWYIPGKAVTAGWWRTQRQDQQEEECIGSEHKGMVRMRGKVT